MIPPAGYLAGVRELCDRHGIVYIADEVMAGFGRSGRWFAVEHAPVVPDLITFAKGVNSGYVPLGGVIINGPIAATFDDRVYPGGLTYSGHPLACAAAVATIETMHDEGIVENADRLGREVFGPGLAAIAEAHPSVGEVRGTGAFWAIELVADPGDPRAAGAVRRVQRRDERRRRRVQEAGRAAVRQLQPHPRGAAAEHQRRGRAPRAGRDRRGAGRRRRRGHGLTWPRTPEVRAAHREKAVAALCAPELAPIVDLVVWVEDGTAYAANHLGRVRWDADDTRVVEHGTDPIGSEDPMAFLPYEREVADPSPELSTGNSYPYAAARLRSFFADPERSPDLAIVHTPRHQFLEAGGHVGEHGSLDVIQSRAPLVLSGAGVAARGFVDDHARLVDVGPTLAVLAGVPEASLDRRRRRPARRPPAHDVPRRHACPGTWSASSGTAPPPATCCTSPRPASCPAWPG